MAVTLRCHLVLVLAGLSIEGAGRERALEPTVALHVAGERRQDPTPRGPPLSSCKQRRGLGSQGQEGGPQAHPLLDPPTPSRLQEGPELDRPGSEQPEHERVRLHSESPDEES